MAISLMSMLLLPRALPDVCFGAAGPVSLFSVVSAEGARRPDADFWGSDDDGGGDATCFCPATVPARGIKALFGFLATSPTMRPRIQQFTAKKAKLAANSPGTNVLLPKNSSW